MFPSRHGILNNRPRPPSRPVSQEQLFNRMMAVFRRTHRMTLAALAAPAALHQYTTLQIIPPTCSVTHHRIRRLLHIWSLSILYSKRIPSRLMTSPIPHKCSSIAGLLQLVLAPVSSYCTRLDPECLCSNPSGIVWLPLVPEPLTATTQLSTVPGSGLVNPTHYAPIPRFVSAYSSLRGPYSYSPPSRLGPPVPDPTMAHAAPLVLIAGCNANLVHTIPFPDLMIISTLVS